MAIFRVTLSIDHFMTFLSPGYSAKPASPQINRRSASASCGHDAAMALGSYVLPTADVRSHTSGAAVGATLRQTNPSAGVRTDKTHNNSAFLINKTKDKEQYVTSLPKLSVSVTLMGHV